MYALIQGNAVDIYPFTQSDLQAIYPGASVPVQWSPEFMASEGIVTVFSTGASYDPRTQTADQVGCEYNEDATRWETAWVVRDLTPEEIAAQDAQQAEIVRDERNARLAECDWTQLADAPTNHAEWAVYRQALRDVPEQSGFPWNVIWPVSP